MTKGVPLPPEIEAWFNARGWRARDHQREMFEAAQEGKHALLVADTGAGKTLAGFLPTLADFAPSRLAGSASAGRFAHALRLAAEGAGA